MKRSNYLFAMAAGIALSAMSMGNAYAIGDKGQTYEAGIKVLMDAAASDGVVPKFAVGNCYDYYPLAVNNVLALSSTLEVSNLADTANTFSICAVPAGTSEQACRYNIAFGPRDARFFTMPQISGAFVNTVGQLYVYPAGAGAVGASQMLIFGGDNKLSAVVNPTPFCY